MPAIRSSQPAQTPPAERDGASPTGAIVALAAVSGVAIAFLAWLIYGYHAPSAFETRLRFLPALEAGLNGMSAVALIAGYLFIRRGRIAAHRASMIAAFGFSVLFFAAYVAHHALHGEMRFAGHGAVRTVYLAILISHILLSAVALPLVLVTFFFALTGRFRQHRRIARLTLPLWLYVSVTGVAVYAMLAGWS